MDKDNEISLAVLAALMKGIAIKYGAENITSIVSAPPNGIKFTLADGSSNTITLSFNAEGVSFDDSKANLGATELQSAIEKLLAKMPKIDNELSETSTNPVENKAITKELTDKASLTEENNFTAKNNFQSETLFNGNIEVFSSNLNVTNGAISFADETSDTVTKHNFAGVQIENNGEAMPYTILYPKKSGTFALLADNTALEKSLNNKLKDKLNILGLGETNRVYVRKTDNLDSSLPFTYSAEASSIAYRNPSGQLQVESPSQDKDAANKSYVDKSQKYLSLYGESGTLDDSQYALVTQYDNLIIQRSGLDFRRCGYPSNGQGNYVFFSDYNAKPNGTEEWADYFITIKQDKTWDTTIKNHIQVGEQTYPDVIELTPSSATNGTLSDDNFDLLTNHYDIRIKLNNELYDFADDQSTTGVISYVHTGWNGTAHQDKSINITLSTKAWTLKVGGTNTFEHIINVSGNNDDNSDAFEFMFLFTSGKAAPVTTQSELMNLIGTDTQLPVSGWRKTGGVYYPVLYIKGGNTYYYLNSSTGPALAGVASLGNYSITDVVK